MDFYKVINICKENNWFNKADVEQYKILYDTLYFGCASLGNVIEFIDSFTSDDIEQYEYIDAILDVVVDDDDEDDDEERGEENDYV